MRLAFGSLDFGHAHADGLTTAQSTWAAPTVDATTTRSGRGRSGKIVTTTAGGAARWELVTPGTPANGIEYLFRVWIYFTALPSVQVPIITAMASSVTTINSVLLNTDGTIQGSAAFVNAPSAALATNTWHCIEYRVVKYATSGAGAGQGQWEQIRVNGTPTTVFTNVTTAGSIPARFRFGVATDGLTKTLSPAWTCYFEDWALNDGTGASDNSYPGNTEKVVLLLPASDNAVGTDWKLGGGTAPSSNAFASVDNVPPTGKSAPATSDQLEDAVANITGAASQADLNLETYTAAGVGAGDTVRLVQAIAERAVSSTTTPPGLGLQLTSNPAEGSETVTAAPASAVGTYPSNWSLAQNAIVVTPTVTLGSAPVLRLAKRTNAATTKLYVAAAGLYVAYEPGTGTTAALSTTIAAVASASGTLRGTANLSSSITAQAAVAATPSATGRLSTTIAATGDVSATLIPLGVGGMVTTITATGDLSAALRASGTLATTIAAHATASGTLGNGAISSTIAAHSGFTAVLLAPGRVLAVGHGIGSGLFIELTTLHYPGTPAVVLAVLQQFDGVEIPIPINDSRTAKVSLSVYDDSVWLPVHDHFGGTEDVAYRLMVRVRYFDKPVFWGVITVPDWQGEAGKVTLNAVDRGLSLQHAYLRYGDQTIDGTLDVAMNGAKGARFPVTTQGLRLLRDAGKNDANETSHGVPDLGIIDGFAAATPVDLDPVPLVPFRRHDEVWRSMQELSSHELAPDFELEPIFDVPGAYAKLNTYFPRGTDRTGSVRLYYGFGPDNLADFDATPGGKLITRQTAVTGDGKLQKVVTAWDSAAERGIYGAVDPVEYDSKGGNLGDILALKAKQQIRAYRVPPKFVKVTLKPEAAIGDPLRRYRYGRDFDEGDTVWVEAKKGWMRYVGPARITQVTLRQTDPSTVVPELELVPDVGAGTVEVTGD